MPIAPFQAVDALFALPFGVILVNTEGVIEFANGAAAQIFDQREDELFGKHFTSLFDLSIAPKALSIHPQIVQIRHRPVQIQKATLSNKQGVHVHPIDMYILTIEAASEQDARSLLAAVSYQVRGPLTVARGHLDLLLRGLVGPVDDDIRSLLEATRLQMVHMTIAFNQLLLFTNIETGTLVNEPAHFSVSEALQVAIHRTSYMYQEKRLQLDQKQGEEVGSAYADPDHARHILYQILDNAMRFSPVEGVISIASKRYDKEIWIQIEDEGIGIPEKDQPFLFDRTHSIHREGSRVSPAMSFRLGLYIAEKLAERNNIKIIISSVENKGTKVSIRIPAESV